MTDGPDDGDKPTIATFDAIGNALTSAVLVGGTTDTTTFTRTKLDQVVTEMRTAHPDRVIDSDIDLGDAIVCDRTRIGQMFSNLLANAISHGDPAGPVRVRARSEGDVFELSVANQGAPIDPEPVRRLFLPFVRGADQSGSRGLGLGLYIASEIARAHGGSLEAFSTAEETRFTFRMNCVTAPP